MRSAADLALEAVREYHDGTKHHFHQFARSLGYLDWASQPSPFRTFVGAPDFPLFPRREARGADYSPQPRSYDGIFDESLVAGRLGAGAIGDLLRHSLGLSAWKRSRESRWSLRVNPSSGNLHPTEAYVICGSAAGLADGPAVYHYAADRHALQQRCAFEETAWSSACGGRREVLLVALTSIHWRESWKYGERGFRYCQHDLGHAIGTLAIAAATLGWSARLLPRWAQRDIAALTGIDRDEDFVDAEREEPGCLVAIGPGDLSDLPWDGDCGIVAAIRTGRWTGRAKQLSADHIQWTFIDDIARATEDTGRVIIDAGAPRPAGTEAQRSPRTDADARRLILQRRSAVAFDGRSSIDRAWLVRMLRRVMPSACAPWATLWWTPRIHFALFVHRVDDLESGLYLLARRRGALDECRVASDRQFLWEAVDDELPLVRLARGDCRGLARRLSCDQDIAADGFFSLGMIAEFDQSLETYGPSFYRHLFWESGFVGQLLYLEAEAAGSRATGIGCFFDDPVHDVLGLKDHRFQSLYHFTVGMPVEDARLTTEPGYEWERGARVGHVTAYTSRASAVDGRVAMR